MRPLRTALGGIAFAMIIFGWFWLGTLAFAVAGIR
jgi:hypothetical protein